MTRYIYLLVFPLLLCIASCGNTPKETPIIQDVYILTDYTEGQNYEITFDEVRKHTKGVTIQNITLIPIRDISLPHSSTLSLEIEDHSGNAHVKRKKEQEAITNMEGAFTRILTSWNSEYSGKEMPHSAIVQPLGDVIDRANSGDYIFVFSDLLENTERINFRKINTEKIKSFLDDNLPIKDVNIIAVVEPSRKSDDNLIRQSIQGWKQHCEGKSTSFKYLTNL